MIEYKDDTIIIHLKQFSKKEVQEGLLAIMKYVYLEQQTVCFNWGEQQGYYILLEILKASLQEDEKRESDRKEKWFDSYRK